MQSSIYEILSICWPKCRAVLTSLGIFLRYRWAHTQTRVCTHCPTSYYVGLQHTNWQLFDSLYLRADGNLGVWAEHPPGETSKAPPPPSSTQENGAEPLHHYFCILKDG